MTKAPIPDFPTRDLKIEEITKCAHEDWDFPKLKNPNLEPVLASFRANIARVRFHMLLPTAIAGQMALTQRAYDIAEHEITGELRPGSGLTFHRGPNRNRKARPRNARYAQARLGPMDSWT